ncbi:hypothetical protein M2323_001771 [Rhodoblastus acidophilus]|uniref:hypothetical protein n=1 Tax=Rhodoblastus acidophilus TaxID=1074 RepID=UPI002224CBE7|nr:hypothetical protein [Rhodoblastus acidophilus]MCW2283797.1 hypothetical protein [Rhodoblastus acidophilus]MCW2332854.1 hypothetical protein [Rhodoblastus acidophilus]
MRERYPNLSAEDQEAIRQRVVLAMNLTKMGKAAAAKIAEDGELRGSAACVGGVRQYAMDGPRKTTTSPRSDHATVFEAVPARNWSRRKTRRLGGFSVLGHYRLGGLAFSLIENSTFILKYL